MYEFRCIVLLAFLINIQGVAKAQCCAGGSGSPIAGGHSQGVLMERQIELNTNFQFINSSQFYTGNKKDTLNYFDHYSSTYEYFRLAYGVNKNFTFSVESGYYINKKETGLNGNPVTTYQTQGIGDLLLFPRYDIINWTEEKHRTEVTFGMGVKIPLGSYNDSTGNVEPFSGQTYYVTNPQAVQQTSGAQDIIFYLFGFRGYPQKKISFMANALYIKKGWNPIGEKLGDYFNVGVFCSTALYKKLGITLQVREEWLKKMQLNETVLLYAYPNYDPEATGYTKIFFTPQLSYSAGHFTFFGLTEIPIYQNVVKTQIGSQYLTTLGISYRFFLIDNQSSKIAPGDVVYVCPMHPDIMSNRPGICSKCGMDLVKK